MQRTAGSPPAAGTGRALSICIRSWAGPGGGATHFGQRSCAGCRILQDLDDENALVLVEEWSSRQAFERHLRSDDYRRLLAVAELAAGSPEFCFDRVAERRGLGLACRPGRVHYTRSLSI